MAKFWITISALTVLTLSQVSYGQVADCGAFPEVIVILDSSGSITDNGAGNWQRMTQFGANIITLLENKPDIRFSYISFSDDAILHVPLTRDARAVKTAILTSVHQGGFTNQAAALKQAQNVFLSARQLSGKYVVIATDGSPNLNQGDESKIAAQLRQQGVLNIAVGVTNKINQTNLWDIVGNRMNQVFLRQSFSQLDNAFTQLIATALSACPPTPGNCDVPEIVICIDSSGSFTGTNTFNWDYMKMFIVRLATQLFQDLPNVRIGLVSFSQDANIILKLTNSLNRIVAESNNLAQQGPATNLAAGLRRAEEVFYDARIPSSKYVIVVTDGKPTLEKGEELVVAQRLKIAGGRFIMIGVADEIDPSNLQQILRQVAGPEGTVLLSPTFRELGNQVPMIVNSVSICSPRPTNCNRPEVALVLDASGSIRDNGANNWELMKGFALDLVAGLKDKRDIRFTFVVFSEDAQIVVPLTSDTLTIESAIRTAQYVGSYTNHAAALRETEYSFLEARPNSTQYIILVTDGVPTVEIGLESEYAKRLRQDGVRIIAIGVTNKINVNKLIGIAGDTGVFFQSSTFTSLSGDVNRVINAASTCRDDPPPNCDGPPEIVVILDASGSIVDKGLNNWALMREFGQRLIFSLSNKKDARFAYVRFSEQGYIDSPFTNDITLIRNVIGSSGYIGGYTSHADALRKAQEVLLTRRANSAQYVIMVTDGEATWDQGQEFGIADLLKNQGVVMILIGVTNNIDVVELRRLAAPQGYYFPSPTFDELPAQIYSVVKATNLCVEEPICDVAYVVLAIDTSSSIEDKGRGNSERMKSFASQLAVGLVSRYPNMKLALVTFDGTADVALTFDQYSTLEEYQRRIDAINFLGILTNLADAIRKSTNVIVSGARSSSQIILITDGQPTIEEDRTEFEASNAKSLGIRIITMGVTSEVDRSLLQRISGNPQRSFYSPGFESLGNQVAEVIQVSCNRTTTPKPPDCENILDIVFVIDASASITDDTAQGWVDAKDAIKSVVTGISSRNPEARFGMVVFSTSARVYFELQSDSDYVMSLVDNTQYIGERTNIAEGIKVAREQVFVRANRNAKRVMVIITDGKSNERINEEINEAGVSKASPFDISIVVAGVTNSPDADVLRQIASSPNKVIRAPNYATLSNEIEQIASVICSIRQPPTPPPTIPPCHGTNVIFLVDDTSRLELKRPGNFERLKYLILELARSISNSHPDAKFGMVTYGYPASQIASFTYYRDFNTFETVVRRLRYRNTQTALAAGFRMVAGLINGYQGYSQVLVIGDGDSAVEPGVEVQESWNLRSQLVTIVAIVVSDTYSTTTLSRMISQPSYIFYALDYNPENVQRSIPSLLQTCMGWRPPAYNPGFPGTARPQYPPAAPEPLFPQNTPRPDPNVILPLIIGTEEFQRDFTPRSGFPADIALLVDVSSSINRNTWTRQKALLTNLVESFRPHQPNVRFGGITYSSIAKLGFALTNVIDTAKSGIDTLSFMNQRTNIVAALKMALDMLDSPTTSKTVVLFTDGDPNVDEGQTLSVSQSLRLPPHNIRIVAIDITRKGNKTAMEKITGDADHVLMEADADKLTETVKKVIEGKSGAQNDVNVRPQLEPSLGLSPAGPNVNQNQQPQPAPERPRPRVEPFIAADSNIQAQPVTPAQDTTDGEKTNPPTTRPTRVTTRPTLPDKTTRPSG